MSIMMDLNKLTSEVQVSCDGAHLRHNFRLLSKYGFLLPVMKADAYGHGMLFVAKVLADEGSESMAVGMLSEGLVLRQAGIQGEIVLLMGILGFDEAKLALQHDLTLVMHSLLCIHNLEKAASCLGLVQVPVGLKLNTGMGRLGFNLLTLPEALLRIQEATILKPMYVLSHCAVADNPAFDSYTMEQSANFVIMLKMIHAYFSNVRISFANSAALCTCQAALQAKLVEDIELSQDLWGRPGLALYGLNPFHGTSKASLYASLKPVMSVTAPVLAVHDVQAGASLGYGCTFTASNAMRIAIVGIGYAHGYARQFSNKAFMVLHGVRVPVIGRVCMQMTIVDISHVEGVMPEDRAYVLGGSSDRCEPVSVYELADWAQTIPYEIVCSLGKNLHIYTNIDEQVRF